MTLYIITHKRTEKYGDENYKLLQVGSSLSFDRFGDDYILDSDGDNISDKNKSFCELTGLYWIWKNSDEDIIGLEHYRRYFVEPYTNNEPLKTSTILEILSDYDIILPTVAKQPNSIRYGWSLIHHMKDMDILRQVILKKYPKYIREFDIMLSSHKMYICNMMICNKDLCDKYCKWLFDILFEVERRVDISTYDTMQKRLFGFLSERLLNVWVLHNNLKIMELKMHNTESKKFAGITSKIYNIARYVFHIDILYFQVYRKIRFYRGE